MNAEGLLGQYARIADAPDAIARLRRFVIELAVRGKLLPQEPTDGDASISLQGIKSIRATQEKAKKIKATKLQYGPIAAGQDFELPAGWARSTIGETCDLQTGATPDRTRADYFDGDIPWLVSGDINRGEIFECDGRITQRGLEASNCKILPKDAVLIALNGQGKTRATVALLRMQAACNQSLVAIISLAPHLLAPTYLHLNLKSRYHAIREVTGKDERRGLNMRLIACFEIAIPPAEEQHRIVAKVDELMALCDQLEAARAQREATRDRLAAASLARLNTPDPDTFPADARFALDALPALTTRPDQIKQLRQTILNLAVRGKLVPQNPNDEPASVLLSSIAAQEMRSTKAGSRKRRELQTIDLDEAPFDLPSGWAWGRFPEFGIFGRGKSKHRPRNDARLFEEGSHPLIQTGDVARSNGVIETITNYYNDFGLAQSFKWPKGTLCITIAANIADSGILSFAACFPDSVVGFIPAPAFKTARYFEYFVRTAKANLLEFAPATAQKNINLEILNSVLIPLPPLAEQERIVTKVDELMALCDQLEASLTTGEATRSRLLDALLHEALAPVAKASSEHPRAAISSYVISRLSAKRNFGRTAHMKYLFLAEARLGLKLGGRYMREAAGPLDTGIYELEKQAQAAGWYTHSVETLASGNEKVSYKPGKVLDAIVEEGIAVLGPARAEMDRLIDLMGGLKTEQVEIIATLFAAWNDAVLDGHAPDDDWIIKEVREHWHVSKQRFAPADLHTWLGWMRQYDVVPLGYPPRTIQQTTMEL